MGSFTKREIEVHPLLLPQSQSHYDIDDETDLRDYEREVSIEGAFGTIQYNLFKYKRREKGQNELDEKKIQTFIDWTELLKDLLELGYSRETNLRVAMQKEYPDMRYSL